jgi:hypothetical protein
MTAITHVRTIEHVTKMLGEDLALLKAIICNDDNQTYGNIVRIYVSPDEEISALTDDGIEELKDMIQSARINTKTWHTFLDDFGDNANLVTKIKAQEPR